MNLPDQYAWLLKEKAPLMLVHGLSLYGTKEQPGTGDNLEILSWAAETGLTKMYSNDAVPWCGLYMSVVAKRAGKQYPDTPLWALSWLKFGIPVRSAMLGDVLVFERRNKKKQLIGGHVGIYVGEDSLCYHVLGGNQSDEVSIMRLEKSRCVGIRRPIYSKAMPSNVRVIKLKPNGVVSKNEQ